MLSKAVSATPGLKVSEPEDEETYFNLPMSPLGYKTFSSCQSSKEMGVNKDENVGVFWRPFEVRDVQGAAGMLL